MGALIDDLLAFSRMGRTEMLTARVDLNSLVQQIVNELNIGAVGRNIDWAIQRLPEVDGDPSMIRIVLMNYISNAVKYILRGARNRISKSGRQLERYRKLRYLFGITGPGLT